MKVDCEELVKVKIGVLKLKMRRGRLFQVIYERFTRRVGLLRSKDAGSGNEVGCCSEP
jgi:hypothetical protein